MRTLLGCTILALLLFGSVAEKVVRLANVPVLTISERVAQASAKTERTQPAYAPSPEAFRPRLSRSG